MRGREQRETHHNAWAGNPAYGFTHLEKYKPVCFRQCYLVKTTLKSVWGKGGGGASPSTSLHTQDPRTSYRSQSEPIIPWGPALATQLLHAVALTCLPTWSGGDRSVGAG